MSAKPPFLAAAFFCDNLLIDQDGVGTAVRIVDRIFIQKLNEPGATVKEVGALTMYLSFKAGGYVGKAKLQVKATTPSGKTLGVTNIELEFSEQASGANLAFRSAFAFAEEGVHWLDVNLNGELVTRMPLDVQLLTPEMLRVPAPAPDAAGS